MNCIEAIKWMRERPDNISISPDGYFGYMTGQESNAVWFSKQKNFETRKRCTTFTMQDLLGEWEKLDDE